MKKPYLLKKIKFLLLAMVAIISVGKSKAQVVYADPALVDFNITDLSDVTVNALLLNVNTVYKLKLQLTNSGPSAIPVQETELVIGLGSYLNIAPGFVLASAPLSNYFTWTSGVDPGGQVTITGNLHTPLPQSFFAYEAVFNIKPINPTPTGLFYVTGNWSITHNNGTQFLVDIAPGNNTSNIEYKVVAGGALPVTITKFSAVKKDCHINVNWSVAQELNLSKYEVEVSKDGINFQKAGEVAAQNQSDYATSVALTDNLRAPTLQVRLKCIDLDGSFKYSSIAAVAGTCSGKSQFGIYSYPNPVTRDIHAITIANRDGFFNGTYQLTLSDMSGKVYSVKEMLLNNVSSFRFDVSQLLASGKYVISIRKKDGTENGVIQFQKL